MSPRLLRRSLPLLFTLALCGTAVALQGVFNQFSARPSGDEVILQWTTANEEGVTAFQVERRSSETPGFRRIAAVEPKGAGRVYTFVDQSAFFKEAQKKNFSYRVVALGPSPRYSSEVTVTQEVSSVRKSWGMLKELFR